MCDYIEVPRSNPAGADDRENNYVFERPVTFRHPTGLTSTGFIDLYKRGKQQQPAILAALCDAVSMALRRRQELPAQGTDAEIWAQAAAPALNATNQEMREALATSKFQTQPDPLINQIDDLVSSAPTQEWKGTAKLLNDALEPDSALRNQLTAALDELTGAGRSVRLLADFLERNPSAVVRGRTVSSQ